MERSNSPPQTRIGTQHASGSSLCLASAKQPPPNFASSRSHRLLLGSPKAPANAFPPLAFSSNPAHPITTIPNQPGQIKASPCFVWPTFFFATTSVALYDQPFNYSRNLLGKGTRAIGCRRQAVGLSIAGSHLMPERATYMDTWTHREIDRTPFSHQ